MFLDPIEGCKDGCPLRFRAWGSGSVGSLKRSGPGFMASQTTGRRFGVKVKVTDLEPTQETPKPSKAQGPSKNVRTKLQLGSCFKEP